MVNTFIMRHHPWPLAGVRHVLVVTARSPRTCVFNVGPATAGRMGERWEAYDGEMMLEKARCGGKRTLQTRATQRAAARRPS